MDYISSTATASLPFAPSRSFSSMTDEDAINLRTLQRLVLLLSGIQMGESSSSVRAFACLVSWWFRRIIWNEKLNTPPSFSWKFKNNLGKTFSPDFFWVIMHPNIVPFFSKNFLMWWESCKCFQCVFSDVEPMLEIFGITPVDFQKISQQWSFSFKLDCK